MKWKKHFNFFEIPVTAAVRIIRNKHKSLYIKVIIDGQVFYRPAPSLLCSHQWLI
jgi:hypothetical protein